MMDDLPPKISIIVTNYNDGKSLATALAGICQQSPPPDEVIVVDDGSSDNSVEIIDRFCQNHAFVTLVQHPTNKGVQAAGRTGLDRSSGDYVGWFAADDEIVPGFFQNVHDAIRKHPNTGVVFGDVVVIPEDAPHEQIRHRQIIAEEPVFLSSRSLVDLLQDRYIWIAPNAAVIRRDALVASGGWHKDLEWLSDWFAAYTVALRHGVAYIPHLSGKISYRPGSYSKAAQSDRDRQKEVYKAFIRTVSSPDYEDIRRIIKLAPILLLQPLGPRILWHLALSWPAWDVFIPTIIAKIRFSIMGRMNRSTSRQVHF